MARERIVDAGTDAALVQFFEHAVTVRMKDHEEMARVFGPRLHGLHFDAAPPEPALVLCGEFPASLRPGWQVRKLHTQHRRLELGCTRVRPDEFVLVLRALRASMVA